MLKSFDFSRLPKVTREEIRLLETLQSLLPRIGFSDELLRSITRLITKEVGPSVSLKKESFRSVSFSQIRQSLAKEGVFVMIGMAPSSKKAFLELDPLLSFVIIDRLLGGSGETPTFQRSFTDIEEAILSYLFLKVLSEIFERCGKSARVHFRLEGFESSASKAVNLLREGESCLSLVYRLQVGERAGYVKLYLPFDFVEKIFIEPLAGMSSSPDSHLSERELHYYAARLWNLGFLPAHLWAEVGRVSLNSKEIKQLDPGDVVLLDRTDLHFEGGKIKGSLPLRVDKGEHGLYRGRVVSEEETLKLQLEGMELEGGV